MTGLHLRARGIPFFLAGLVVIAPLAAVAAHWLATRSYFDGPGARVPVVVLAPLLAALLLGPTLAGADDQLERSVPAPWRLIRSGHVAGAVVLTVLALAAAGLPDPEVYGLHALTRNTVGCIGLVAGAAALLGARLAWVPAFGYVCAAYAAAPARDGGWEEIWAWPLQRSTADVSWWAALITAAVGAALYIARGAKP